MSGARFNAFSLILSHFFWMTSKTTYLMIPFAHTNGKKWIFVCILNEFVWHIMIFVIVVGVVHKKVFFFLVFSFRFSFFCAKLKSVGTLAFMLIVFVFFNFFENETKQKEIEIIRWIEWFNRTYYFVWCETMSCVTTNSFGCYEH